MADIVRGVILPGGRVGFEEAPPMIMQLIERLAQAEQRIQKLEAEVKELRENSFTTQHAESAFATDPELLSRICVASGKCEEPPGST
jgi:transposase